MICQNIIYKGHEILTIYHRGFSDLVRDRRLIKTEKVGNWNLTFTESIIDDAEIETIQDWCAKEVGLIGPSSPNNPYGDRACTYVVHYSYGDKPLSIFKPHNEHYELKLPVQDFLFICDFTKKYTGLDIKSCPMVLGDIFIFDCQKISFKHNGYNGIILDNVPLNTTIFVDFKFNDMVVASKIVTATKTHEALEICSDWPWESHDIKVYSGERLIYFENDVSYIHSISLTVKSASPGESIPLRKIGTHFNMNESFTETTTTIGTPLDEYVHKLQKSSHKIRNMIRAENPDDRVYFIKPGEESQALAIIGNVLQDAKDDLWLFDPYFTDKNGIDKSLDFLRIISKCKSKSKNIVVYSNLKTNNTLNLKDFLTHIKKDAFFRDILRRKNNIGINFYQTKSPIHDRFIIIKSGNKCDGLNIGTSFNSLDRNHYCISKLSHFASKKILTELIYWMEEDNNIISREKV